MLVIQSNNPFLVRQHGYQESVHYEHSLFTGVIETDLSELSEDGMEMTVIKIREHFVDGLLCNSHGAAVEYPSGARLYAIDGRVIMHINPI